MATESPANMAKWITTLCQKEGLSAPTEAALAKIKAEFEEEAQAKLAENLKSGKARINTFVVELRQQRGEVRKTEKKIDAIEAAIAILLNPEHDDHVVVADHWPAVLSYGIDYVKKTYL